MSLLDDEQKKKLSIFGGMDATNYHFINSVFDKIKRESMHNKRMTINVSNRF